MWTNYVIYSTSLRKFVAEQGHMPRALSMTLCYFLGDFKERNVTQTSLTQTVVSGLPLLSVPTLSYRAQNFQSFVICGFYHILRVGFPLLFSFPEHQLFACKSYLDIYIQNKNHGGSCRKMEEGGQKIRTSSYKINKCTRDEW